MNEIEQAIALIDDELDFSGTYDSELNKKIATLVIEALKEKALREREEK